MLAREAPSSSRPDSRDSSSGVRFGNDSQTPEMQRLRHRGKSVMGNSEFTLNEEQLTATKEGYLIPNVMIPSSSLRVALSCAQPPVYSLFASALDLTSCRYLPATLCGRGCFPSGPGDYCSLRWPLTRWLLVLPD